MSMSSQHKFKEVMQQVIRDFNSAISFLVVTARRASTSER